MFVWLFLMRLTYLHRNKLHTNAIIPIMANPNNINVQSFCISIHLLIPFIALSNVCCLAYGFLISTFPSLAFCTI